MRTVESTGASDSNVFKHSFQPRTVSNDLFEIVLNPDFAFQVEPLLHEALLGLSYLPKFQGVFYRDGDLVRYLIKERHITLAEG